LGRVTVKVDEGKVETPFVVALLMVNKLFSDRPPSPNSRVLDAGCGKGVFVEAIIAWCNWHGIEIPEIVGIEVDPQLAKIASSRFSSIGKVKIVQGDFLTITEDELGGKFDYVISNPPYISYEEIEPDKRILYRKLFEVATGRFDTYMLFFEKALSLLKPGGRMVFITPEKYLYVLSAKSLRKLLAEYHVEEIELVKEDAFRGVLAYPAITVVVKELPAKTIIRMRDGSSIEVELPRDGSSWLPPASSVSIGAKYKLKDIALRISAGVATGRDEVFIIRRTHLPEELKPFAYPTISGAELTKFELGGVIDYDKLEYVILVPYSKEGRMLNESEAKPLVDYLSRWRSILESRYAVKSGKKWYAFHEDPPLREMLRPKILWRDIADEPAFYVDAGGLIVPRHTVYYLVPINPDIIPELVRYLSSDKVKKWLKARCQRAANGYLRLQSHVMKELPIPEDIFLKAVQRNKGGLDLWMKRKR